MCVQIQFLRLCMDLKNYYLYFFHTFKNTIPTKIFFVFSKLRKRLVTQRVKKKLNKKLISTIMVFISPPTKKMLYFYFHPQMSDNEFFPRIENRQ